MFFYGKNDKQTRKDNNKQDILDFFILASDDSKGVTDGIPGRDPDKNRISEWGGGGSSEVLWWRYQDS